MRLINAICFLGKQGLAFRSHDESDASSNLGNYAELLNYTAKYDPLLEHHLNTATVFKGVSNRFQNDLIEAVVLRYMHDGQILERFIGFCGVSNDRRIPAIADVIRQYLSNMDCSDKLVAQAYDGAAAFARQH
ncbi:hypothetical protein AVEN_63777-1 [Araneus ventricosus]|uniref:Uncharacterized protein n=1 Tax=Araneus ventricosus TaxID=182803 RepID=A0A4Y2H0C3_ARAVE|nr:hypothetical protein AVEN_63777-1 [Araneus ventricosus]